MRQAIGQKVFLNLCFLVVERSLESAQRRFGQMPRTSRPNVLGQIVLDCFFSYHFHELRVYVLHVVRFHVVGPEQLANGLAHERVKQALLLVALVLQLYVRSRLMMQCSRMLLLPLWLMLMMVRM